MTETMEPSGPERPEPDAEFEAQFAQLMKDVEEGREAAAEEPSARARMLAAKWRDQPPTNTAWRGDAPSPFDGPAKKRRVWPRNLALAVIVGALTVGVVQTMREKNPHAAAAVNNAVPAKVATGAANAASTANPAGGGAISQIAISELYPQTVRSNGVVYTLVTAGALNNCIDSDMVGATLAGMFAQSKGCVGGEGALYKDAANDQFNMTVFTLKDPVDVISILSRLSMDTQDFEVGVLQPPSGSGLPTLSATSGIIQQFESSGHYLGVFMAQWSDGRVSDYGSLQKLLNPLQDTVSATFNKVSRSAGN